MRKYNFISECALETKTPEIPIHLYTMPQKHQEIRLIEEDMSSLKYELMTLNPGTLIESAGHLLGSFIDILSWNETKPLKQFYRPIEPKLDIERRLLERLLSRRLEQSQDSSIYAAKKKAIIPKKYDQIFDNVEMRRYFQFDMNVLPDGSISVGFDLAHQFTYQKSIYDLIRNSQLPVDSQVVDRTNRRTYLFKEISDKPISFPHLPNGQNLIEYYQNLGKGYIVKNIPPETPAVICVSKKDETPLSFIPQLLHPVCTWDKTPKSGKEAAKMSTQDRMKYLSKTIKEVMDNWRMNASDLPLRVKKDGLLAETNGYRVKRMNSPTLLFGKGVEGRSLKSDLKRGGVVSPQEEPLECQFLIDSQIVREFTESLSNGQFEFPFYKELANLSKQLGVPLKQAEVEKKRIKRINFQNAHQLRLELQEVAPYMRDGHPIIIVAKEAHLKQSYGTKDFYSLLKQELGREYGLTTQVVNFETTKMDGQGKDYMLLNILLGLYVKVGIHPWKLKKPLYSDCFIGLDVSHENGIHTTGIIQVVGKDGTTLWTKPLSNAERGEIIRRETIKQAIYQGIRRYKERENNYPTHITFHRDGKGHTAEIEVIQEILKSLNIEFDYVSVVKSALRRMAYKDETSKAWVNPIGCAYIHDSEKLAYLCSTNPYFGMAVPTKVIQLTNSKTFDHIIEDIYQLTNMNVHSLNKSRLPVTINYADKSSTFFSRGMLPLDKEMPVQSV